MTLFPALPRLPLVLATLLLCACGGGGEEGSAAPPPAVAPPAPVPAPVIRAVAMLYADGGFLPGGVFNSYVNVRVLDAGGSTPRSDATVTLNGIPLSYNSAEQQYYTELRSEPGARLDLVVTLEGRQYARTVQHLSTLPVITEPGPLVDWPDALSNTIRWTKGSENAASAYLVAVGDYSGRIVWPEGGEPKQLRPPVSSESVPGRTLKPGSHVALVALVSSHEWPGASDASYINVASTDISPFMVTDHDRRVVSLEFEYPDTAMPVGESASHQLRAALANGERVDVSSLAIWTSADPSVVAIDASGVSTAASPGRTRVTATHAGLTANLEIFSFVLSRTPAGPVSRSTAFQGSPAHDGYLSFAPAAVTSPSVSWLASLSSRPSFPVVGTGSLFLTTEDGHLHALDLDTGSPRWMSTRLGPSVTGPAYDQARVFVASQRELVAFDASTGHRLWSRVLPGDSDVTAAPTAVDGIVYISINYRTFAVHAPDGEIMWSRPSSGGSPAVSVDGLYLSQPCLIRKYSPISGRLMWDRSGGCVGLGGSTAALAPWGLLVREPLNTTPEGRSMQIFDPRTGAATQGALVMTIPALRTTGGGYHLFARTLHSSDLLAGSTPSWTFTGDGTLTTPPLIVDDTVFAGGESGMVYALDAGTGSLRWSADAGAPIPPGHDLGSRTPSAMGAADGWLLVPVTNGLRAWKVVQ